MLSVEGITYEFDSKFNERYSLVARKIIRMLSDDARISNTAIANKLGITRQAVSKRLNKIEKEFGVNYTLEINEEALGLTYPHLILVRFEERPDYNMVKKLFLQSYIPQFVATLDGGYDLLVYANSTSRNEYTHWDKGMQMLLSDYKVSWYASEIAYKQLGFFSLRNEIINRTNIDNRYKELLKVLNVNSRISLKQMSDKLHVHFNILRYNFKKLLETNYIRRFTIVEKPIEDTAMMYYFAKLTPTNRFEQCAANARKALMYDDSYPSTSRYSFCSQLIGSGDFFVLGVFDDRKIGYRRAVLHYKNVMRTQKVKIWHGVIDKILVGKMPLRSVNNKTDYKIPNWTPHLE